MTPNDHKQQPQMSRRKQLFLRVVFIVIGGLILVVFGVQIQNQISRAILISQVPPRAPALQDFPDVKTSNLSDTQVKVVTILKQEYATLPAGTKYTEGALEDWCADFVSWVMKEAGVPLLNKGNGSWRLELTEPLLEYYKSVDLFEPAGNGYTAKAGDIAIYEKPSPFGNHVNIVIENNDGAITTAGGNENNTIRIRVNTPLKDAHFLGYGKLPQADTSEKLKKQLMKG